MVKVKKIDECNEVVGPGELVETLHGLCPFYYWPNEGNLGDYLIAEATRQFFRRNHLTWKEYSPEEPPSDDSYHLVYGGGGRFVSHWGGIELFEAHLSNPRVRRCVVLPHSIQGVDSLVKSFDSRHVVFCREQKSLAYCCSLNSRAAFRLAHDMGLCLQVADLPGLDSIAPVGNDADEESRLQYELLTGGAVAHARYRMTRATIQNAARRFSFVLRTDKEKSIRAESEWAYDVSILYSASCRETAYSAQLVYLMADILRSTDVVVTDRLHVAIMAMHVGKEVYMLDNDYGKLSGVYELSLQNRANVHLLPPDEPWPMELQRAWKKLNSPWRDRYFAARRLARRVLNKIKAR